MVYCGPTPRLTSSVTRLLDSPVFSPSARNRMNPKLCRFLRSAYHWHWECVDCKRIVDDVALESLGKSAVMDILKEPCPVKVTPTQPPIVQKKCAYCATKVTAEDTIHHCPNCGAAYE